MHVRRTFLYKTGVRTYESCAGSHRAPHKTITRTDMGTTKTAVSVDIEIYNFNGLLLSKQTKEF